jgi:hypothetical protein
MKNYSKKLLIFCFSGFLSLLGMTNASAQMGEAQKQNIDVSKTTNYTASAPEIWEIISKLNEVERYANGYIVSSVVKGDQLPIERTVKLKSGIERKEEIQQLNEPYKFYCFNITSPLPQGIEEAVLACTITVDETDFKKCNVKWWAVIKGNSESKKELIADIEKEFDEYAAGLSKLLKK